MPTVFDSGGERETIPVANQMEFNFNLFQNNALYYREVSVPFTIE